jgi:hypothetical protein
MARYLADLSPYFIMPQLLLCAKILISVSEGQNDLFSLCEVVLSK